MRTRKIPNLAKSQWTHAWLKNVELPKDGSKVPYLPDLIPSLFTSSESMKKAYRDFAVKHSPVLPRQNKAVVILTYYRWGSKMIV